MQTTYTLPQWLAFLARHDSTGLPTETIDDLTADAVDPDWTAGPVGLMLPAVVSEFNAMSTRLGDAFKTGGEDARARAFETMPALFRVGCAVGDAMETLQEAREQDDPDAERAAHAQLRGVWAVLTVTVGDYR